MNEISKISPYSSYHSYSCTNGTNGTNGTSDYRFALDKSSKKHNCPNCTKKRYVRYIDTETGEFVPNKYGRCDRESNCAYHLSPYNDGYSKMIWEQEEGKHKKYRKLQRQKLIKKPKQISEGIFIPIEVFKRTHAGYEKNVFIKNLLERIPFPFEPKDIEKVISQYYLGTIRNGYRAGAITFPFIDKNNNVRTIQVKQFNESNHTIATDFLHSIIEKYYASNNEPLPKWLDSYKKNELKVSCLFGEHLLGKYPNNPIALAEAPKTIIYGTLYFGFPELPENLLWLAVYNKSSFSFDKLKILKGRDVYVFPDLSKDGSTYQEWKRKAENFESRISGTRFIFSDLLERLAPRNDKLNGNDLADFLIKFDWRQFRKQSERRQSIPVISKSSIYEKCEPAKKIFITQVNPIPKTGEFKTGKFEQLKLEQPENRANDKMGNASEEKNHLSAYVDKTGRLFIENPFANLHAIYPNIEAYNNRTCLPDYMDRNPFDLDQFSPVQIDLKTLTIKLK